MHWLAPFVLLLAAACGAADPSSGGLEGEIAVDSARIFYRMVGHGRDTVVVVHGGPAVGGGYLEQVLGPLARRHTLVFYDQRGRGRSARSPVDTSAIGLATDLADLDTLRARLHLGRFAVVGHHYGSLVAALYARRHPEQVDRLVLVGPFIPRHSYIYPLSRIDVDSGFQSSLWRALERGEDDADPAAFCRRFWGLAFAPAVVDDPAVVARLAGPVCRGDLTPHRDRERIARAVYRSFGDRWSFEDSLRAVATPALVVEGEGRSRDGSARHRAELLLRGATTWAAALKEARLVTLPGAPLFPWTADESRFRRVVDEFLNSRRRTW